MCVETYLYIPTARVFFFWWVCPLTAGGCGGGRGGYGVGNCTMDPGLGQNCVPPLKNTTNWATDFVVHSKKGKGLKVVG